MRLPWRAVVVFAPLSFKMGWGRVIAVWAVVTWVFFWRWRVFFWTRVLPLTRTRGKTKLQLPEGNRKKTNNKINVELIKQLHITCVFFFPPFLPLLLSLSAMHFSPLLAPLAYSFRH